MLAATSIAAQENELAGDWVVVTTGFAFVGGTTSYVNLSI